MEKNENLKNLSIHIIELSGRKLCSKFQGKKLKMEEKIVSQKLHEKTSKSGAAVEK